MNKIGPTATAAQKRLRQYAMPENKKIAMWFFKTQPGGYSEHDQFIGVKVPRTRLVAKEFQELSFPEVQKLIQSQIHEDRLLALFILVLRFKKAAALPAQAQIAKFLIKNIKHVNNWDLVDSSAEYILGAYLRSTHSLAQQKVFLKKYARSKNIWCRRISVMTTFHFIRHHEYKNTLFVADILLQDPHDLIHKAMGWMLREVGNRDLKLAEQFLKTRYKIMPRTMLRYSIEKFPESKRKRYLLGRI